MYITLASGSDAKFKGVVIVGALRRLAPAGVAVGALKRMDS
jgi:hypothetical protein